MSKKLKKSRRDSDHGEPFEPVQAGPSMNARAVILSGAFSMMSAMVLYNAFALQPGHYNGQIAAGNAISLRYDPMVEDIQRQLLTAGYFKGLVDGVAGEKTKSAIIAYQASAGLSADGEASQALLDHIRLEQKISDAANYTASTDAASTLPAQRNVAGRKIFLVQSALYDLGYDPGDISGGMSEATRSAIRRFEADRHLSVTGEINDNLLAELAKTTGYESLAKQ